MFQGDEGNKKSSPQGKKHLTFSTKCGRINMKRGRTPPKPERVTTMKKSTFEAIKDALTHFGFDDAEILSELDKEINRGAEAKAKNAEAYEAIHDIVVGNLSDAPVTCGELYEAIESELPMGITKGKVQYALTHLWQDEIVKIEGKPNTYRRA
jgi:hypothetical protein